MTRSARSCDVTADGLGYLDGIPASPAVGQTCAGMLSQPRTADDDEKTALGRSTSQSGKRVNTSSSAIRPSMRASALPRQ